MIFILKTYFVLCAFMLCAFGTKFERKIFNVLAKEKSQENLIFSPISIEVALALGYFATKGETRQEIGDLLDLQTDSSRVENMYDNLIDVAQLKYNMSIVNKIWVQKSLEVRSRFQEIAKRSFNSDVSNVDFADGERVVEEINAWVDQATHHKITDIVKSVKSDTFVILLNAVYFKGLWENQFKPGKRPGKFWNHGHTMTTVSLMLNSRHFLFADLKEISAMAIEIPYKIDGLSMLILLPKEKNGLLDMEDKLTAMDVLDLVKDRLSHRLVKVIMPKFSIKTEIDLGSVLRKIGVQKIFSSTADFSGLLESNETSKVTSAAHSAFIDVNESGTEAAAATRINVSPVSSFDRFVVDHPFMYLIKDNERIYFMGHVVEL